ncbi:MAG: putative FeS assembly SUF system protein SufT [Candidatus Aldehydirespiratoraceae bacterium]|jgi:probable FeS assembly SUF system protein SufT
MAEKQEMSEQPVAIGATRGFVVPRECVVTIVPAGHKSILAEGQHVTVLQALGGTATVTTREGEMARLTPQDSIDFGLIDAPTPGTVTDGADFSIDAVWAAATTVYDPEIPVDIVELGLVYRVDAEELADGTWLVDIDMSVTAPFCGMGDIMRQDLHDAVAALPGVAAVKVVLVFDPPWDASRLSDVARLELGMM